MSVRQSVWKLWIKDTNCTGNLKPRQNPISVTFRKKLQLRIWVCWCRPVWVSASPGPAPRPRRRCRGRCPGSRPPPRAAWCPWCCRTGPGPTWGTRRATWWWSHSWWSWSGHVHSDQSIENSSMSKELKRLDHVH